MTPAFAREVIAATIRLRWKEGWRDGAEDRVFLSFMRAGPMPSEGAAFDWIANALRLERVEPECYPPLVLQ